MLFRSLPDPNASLKNFSQVHGVTAEVLADWTKRLPQGYRPSAASHSCWVTRAEVRVRGSFIAQFSFHVFGRLIDSF